MKPRSSRARAGRLATSFVFTVAALPGCQKAPPDGNTPAGNGPPTPTVAIADASNRPSANPPAIAPKASATASAAPKAEPDEPLPKLCSATDGARPCVDKQDDGTCRLMPMMAKCRPGMMCNPPPPRVVPCP